MLVFFMERNVLVSHFVMTLGMEMFEYALIGMLERWQDDLVSILRTTSNVLQDLKSWFIKVFQWTFLILASQLTYEYEKIT